MNEKDDKKKEKEEKEKVEVDFGVGKLTFSGLFKGINDLVDIASKLSDESGEVKKEGKIKVGKDVKGVYGVNIRTMAGGKPHVETFGNIKQTDKGPVVEEEREPVVDVFDEKDHIQVIAELPGVYKRDIQIQVQGDILKISAKSGKRRYSKEVLLPHKVKEEEGSSSYKNGILDIKLQKEGNSN
ncbi:Hsp20/alpha crystallin family protein [bacterium]|nr:Hsp20/alpha crystallin family protein [bacterium]